MKFLRTDVGVSAGKLGHVLETFPQLLGSLALDSMQAKVAFLVDHAGVSKPKLGQVLINLF